MKFLIFILLLLFSLIGECQEKTIQPAITKKIKFVLPFSTKIVTNDLPCKDVVVNIYNADDFDFYSDSNIILESIKLNPDGVLRLDIPSDVSYLIDVTKKNFIHKRFKVNTEDVPENNPEFKGFNVESISLYEPIEGLNYDIFDYPLILIKYDFTTENFNYDENYSNLALTAISVLKDLESKNSEVIKNEKQKLEQRLSNEQFYKRIKIIMISGGFALLLLITIVVMVYNNNRNKTKNLKIISSKNHEIAIKNQEIIESITYAKRLQEAILPPKVFLDIHVPNNFILYKPKDIVAGDFYWAENINNLFFVAAADSTGHGVPGAMVSVVCSNALNRSVKEFNLTETGKILDKTRELVLETFEKSTSEVKDGMDISLLCIDYKNKNIFWSGANNPLWYLMDNKLIEIKADKQPIGKTDYPKPFTTHNITYVENSTFYLFTDGFADQFGGEKGKKFKYKQFSELLVTNNNLSLATQSVNINKAFEDWKGDLEQVDDVCIIGIKI